MKCPLLMLAQRAHGGSHTLPLTNCLKEECAWWVEASQSCAMEAIPRIIAYLGSELKTIKEKMPHQE